MNERNFHRCISKLWGKNPIDVVQKSIAKATSLFNT